MLRVRTMNVRRLWLEPEQIPGAPGADGGGANDEPAPVIGIDGERPFEAGWIAVELVRTDERRRRANDAECIGMAESVRLASGFRRVFEHRPILVLPTAGGGRERAWAAATARFHAATFRCRGNGRLDVTTDAT